MHKKLPLALVSSTKSQSAALISPRAALGNTPALQHRISIPPWAFATSSIIAETTHEHPLCTESLRYAFHLVRSAPGDGHLGLLATKHLGHAQPDATGCPSN